MVGEHAEGLVHEQVAGGLRAVVLGAVDARGRGDVLVDVVFGARRGRRALVGDEAGDQAAALAFDPVRWESRTADKYGLVDIDSNRYLAGPDSARSKVLAAIRWDTVTLASPATGELLAEYPRQYGRSRNVEDPALVLPRLAVKPRAWRESSIRPDVPDDIRAWLDSMDERTLRESLKAIGDACRAAGFDPAMQACGEILRSNRDMGLHADSLTPIALRMRDGEWEYPGGIEEPDLSGYDRFITGTDDGGEER